MVEGPKYLYELLSKVRLLGDLKGNIYGFRGDLLWMGHVFVPRFGSALVWLPGPLVLWSPGPLVPGALVPWSWSPGFSASVASWLLGFGGFLASRLQWLRGSWLRWLLGFSASVALAWLLGLSASVAPWLLRT